MLLSKLISYHFLLGFTAYFAGVCYLALLCDYNFNGRTYLSEKALSPGVVNEQFFADNQITDYFNLVKHHYEKSRVDSGHFQEWLKEQLLIIGLEAHLHNFTLDFSLILGNQRVHGANVIGILRAYRSFRTEAIVISTPLRPAGGFETDTTGSIALLLTMAKFFRQQTFWAKDLIFVFPEMETVGLQAWLDQYHGISTSRHIRSAELKHRSGSIQCAINLVANGLQFGAVDVNIEGVNGILPNLDLVNTVVQLGKKHSIQLQLHGYPNKYFHDPMSNVQYSGNTMLKMMLHQASGSPASLHGLFLPYEIPAVGITAANNPRGSNRLKSLALVLEGTLRSVNNLQERFHQSFFFYLLPSTDRYVSIGLYMPPFAVTALGLLLSAFDVLLNDPRLRFDSDNPSSFKLPPLGPVVRIFILAYMFAAFAFAAPSYFIRVADGFGIDAGSGLLSGLVAVQIAAASYPKLFKSSSMLRCDDGLLRLASCLFTALTLGSLSLINFSLAFLSAVLIVPSSLLATKRHFFLLKLLAILLHLLSCPLGLLFVGAYLAQHPDGLVATAETSVIQVVVEEGLMGSWTYRFFTLALFPPWIVSWSRLFVFDQAVDDNVEESETSPVEEAVSEGNRND